MLYTEKYGNGIFFDDDSKYYDCNGVAPPKYGISTLPYKTKVRGHEMYNGRISKQIMNDKKKYSKDY